MSEQSQEKINVHRIMLGQREVLLRDPVIKDQNLALEAASRKAGSEASAMYVAYLSSQELVKNLLVKVDGKVLSGSERESLDGLFSIRELSVLSKVVQKIIGGEETDPLPEIEFATFGGQ